MKLFFFRKSFIQFKIFLAVIIALILFFFDYKYSFLKKIRIYSDVVINSFFMLVDNLQKFFNDFLYILIQKKNLIIENERLKKKILFFQGKILLFEYLKHENKVLNELLNSPIQKNERVMVAQIIANMKNMYKYEVIINKGILDGVYIGQSIINNNAVIGQVIRVNKHHSRVLLICNINHSLPVQTLSNNVRMIANGVGCNRDLELKFVSNEKGNIKIGEIIVTSGLGDRFPVGYPVGFVSSIIKRDSNNTIVYIKHNINLLKLRYVLLLWIDSKKDIMLSPSQVNKLAKKRLIN